MLEYACNLGVWGRKVKCCRPACAVYSELQITCNATTDSDKKGNKDRILNFRTSHIKVNSHNFLPRKQVSIPEACLCIFSLQENRFLPAQAHSPQSQSLHCGFSMALTQGVIIICVCFRFTILSPTERYLICSICLLAWNLAHGRHSKNICKRQPDSLQPVVVMAPQKDFKLQMGQKDYL